MTDQSTKHWNQLLLKHRTKLFMLLILLQVLFLLGLSGMHYSVSLYGKEVRIQTAPVDPRDLFYGDYVILNYEISQLNAALWRGSGTISDAHPNVFVVLKPSTADSTLYEAAAIHEKKPELQMNEVLLRGRIEYNYDDTVFIKYGIERYYVPEDTGQEIEDNIGQYIAVIKVSNAGRAMIDDLELSE